MLVLLLSYPYSGSLIKNISSNGLYSKQIADYLKGEVIGNQDVFPFQIFQRIEEGKPGTISFLANQSILHISIQQRLILYW